MNEEKLDRIDNRVTQLTEMMGKLIGTVTDIKTDVSELKTDVSELKTDVSELKTDVSELKTDVSELKTDVSVLKTDVSELKSKFHTLEGKTDDIAQKVVTIHQDYNEFKNETRQNFERTDRNFADIKSELRFMNRKFEVLSDDMVEGRARIIDVEKRVDALEEKDAA